ncbi:hypothetical protein C474_03835 [Halogeometricum pallidum JCM 14848]|uniref:Uncharacterized protein n=1 Tax=Halogeometricum pallidum JCM 14848 TaxID=1227487 RepID=M0DGZ9_HALPD|nr:hypothetical protein [Halogeometricum pallidum]ELZ34058.1 hypothetical protein C474_03835 [Halogeometricum pallidum JCM 14848]
MESDFSLDADSDRTLSRRRLLAGTVAAGTAALTPAFADSATAQSGDDEESVTPSAAVQNTAPTFGNSDYVGLFVQISGYNRDADSQGVGSCAFVQSEDSVTGYDAEMIDTYNDNHESESIVLFAVTQNPVQPGKLFVVNDQSSCGGGYVSLQLEEVGSSSIETPGSTGSGSGSSIPGFGFLAGALGLGAAGAAAARSDD